MSEECQSEPLVTLCLRLLRLADGEGVKEIDTVKVPEVLIGGINSGWLTRFTPTCVFTQVFFCLIVQSVTATENIHTWLHLGSFPCVFLLAKRRTNGHNQDPRGIDWW